MNIMNNNKKHDLPLSDPGRSSHRWHRSYDNLCLNSPSPDSTRVAIEILHPTVIWEQCKTVLQYHFNTAILNTRRSNTIEHYISIHRQWHWRPQESHGHCRRQVRNHRDLYTGNIGYLPKSKIQTKEVSSGGHHNQGFTPYLSRQTALLSNVGHVFT